MQAPYPLIAVPQIPTDSSNDKMVTLSWDMAVIHNVYLRGVNSVWTNAPLVTSKDAVSFAGYALTLTQCIHHHHHIEESIVFPFLSKKLSMEQNIEQHEQFQEGLKKFDEYFEGVFNGTIKYDGKRARELVTGFGDALAQHLHDEIPTIMPDELRKFDKAEFDKMVEDLENEIKNQPGLFTVFPFTLSNHDSKEIPNWPPIPAPLKWFTKNVAVWRHPSYWKFSTFDMAGRPQVYAPA